MNTTTITRHAEADFRARELPLARLLTRLSATRVGLLAVAPEASAVINGEFEVLGRLRPKLSASLKQWGWIAPEK
jgi:hypothetical protein